jgi:hypothetical protein
LFDSLFDHAVKLRCRCGWFRYYARLRPRTIACHPRGPVRGTMLGIVPAQAA